MGFEVLLKGSNLIRLLQGLLTALKISMISVRQMYSLIHIPESDRPV